MNISQLADDAVRLAKQTRSINRTIKVYAWGPQPGFQKIDRAFDQLSTLHREVEAMHSRVVSAKQALAGNPKIAKFADDLDGWLTVAEANLNDAALYSGRNRHETERGLFTTSLAMTNARRAANSLAANLSSVAGLIRG